MTNFEIEAFLNIIKFGSITKAAEALFVSQPALSHRIQALEAELETSLFVRKKGMRNVELTSMGTAFIPIAEKWQELWRESKGITAISKKPTFQVSSVDSINTYIMPQIYSAFMKANPDINFVIRTLHSFEAYHFVEEYLVDLAFVAVPMYSKNVETIPLFKEKMYLVCGKESNYNGKVHPSTLDVAKEIKLEWNTEYNKWHDFWFGIDQKPRIFLDKMSLMEEFLQDNDNWALIPASAAHQFKKQSDLEVHEIEEPPAARICYALQNRNRKVDESGKLISQLLYQMEAIEGIEAI